MESAPPLSRSPWARTVGIVARTAHLGAMAVVVGGAHFAAPHAALRVWVAVTAASGLALLLVEASHSRHWIFQGRGVAALLHVGTVPLLVCVGVSGRAAATAALAAGAIGSHLPRALRKWSFRHRQVVD